MFSVADIRGTSPPEQKYFARLWTRPKVCLIPPVRCGATSDVCYGKHPGPCSVHGHSTGFTARARLKRRVGRTPRGAAPARPKRRQNTPTSHQKRALVGGWSINTTQPPGGSRDHATTPKWRFPLGRRSVRNPRPLAPGPRAHGGWCWGSSQGAGSCTAQTGLRFGCLPGRHGAGGLMANFVHPTQPLPARRGPSG